jgi:tetratricopeptide (TPR) repeat protein
VFEEAYRRSHVIRNHARSAEAAIALVAITGGVQHRFDTADHWARVAEAELEDGGPRSPLRGSYLDARGSRRAASGHWELADEDFTAAIAIREPLLGSRHPDLAASLVNHARASLVLGHAERALQAADRALAIASALHTSGAFPIESARLRRGQALVALGRSPEGRRELETVRKAFERSLGSDHPLLADPLTALAEAALAEHRPADARALLERAWELRATHIADAGAREQTAFSLARAVWDSAPADRHHALELAREAREGFAAIADLAPRLAAVDRWLDTRAPRQGRASSLGR